MNRYALWKYLVILIACCIGGLYTLPNFFGEAPAVQVSPARASVKVDTATLGKVEESLKTAGLTPSVIGLENNSLKARFETTEQQLQAKDAVQQALNPDATNPAYIVALNLIPRTPSWLTALRAAPMYLGLDLRGGVHFMLQVDMQAALTKKLDALSGDVRSALREKSLRHNGISREQQSIHMTLRDQATADTAQSLMRDQFPDLLTTTTPQGSEIKLSANLKPEAARKVQEQALKQNITTLHNRINELGVAEPVIQQQGLDRIVVQLPGVQDTAKAKDILGRTATLEIRMAKRAAKRGLPKSVADLCPLAQKNTLTAMAKP